MEGRYAGGRLELAGCVTIRAAIIIIKVWSIAHGQLPLTLCITMSHYLYKYQKTSLFNIYVLQWSLRVKDTLGLAMLSFVGRLSPSQRFEMYSSYGNSTLKSVLYREVIPFTEGSLLEVPL